MQDDRTTEGLRDARSAWEREREQEAGREQQKYTPRPWWHVAMAWVLLAIVLLGIANLCYWQITA